MCLCKTDALASTKSKIDIFSIKEMVYVIDLGAMWADYSSTVWMHKYEALTSYGSKVTAKVKQHSSIVKARAHIL